MARTSLPNRRLTLTDCIRWPLDGARVHVSAGFAEDGRLLEAFLRGGGRVGSERDHLLDDVAVLLSRALQHGDSVAGIAAALGRMPGGEPASIVGAVLDKLAEMER